MEENNKRIARNTVYLYIRTFVIMALSFVTTRVVLDKLGASDYGIYTLVGGFVAMFVVLNSIMASSTRRFIALYIGKNDDEQLKLCFSTSFIIHIVIGLIVVLLLETFGIWFLNSKLNIAPDRMYAANWVFQISVLGTFFSMIQTPYNAAMTAHEKFNMYAAMSIFDAVAKLAILFCLVFINGDKLIIYASLILCVTLISLAIYRFYCIRNFNECRLSLKINKGIFKEMLSFSSWGVLGHFITVINAQGIAIILNLFFNTVMNAARGLAHTVNLTIAQFVAGFLTAAQPQLVKYYGANEPERFSRLIFNVTRYTLFLLAVIAVPAILEVGYVINLWLGDETPQYTVSFVKITLLCSIIYRSNSMVENGLHAIGRVKEVNLYSVPVYLLSLPLVYLVLWLGWGPLAAYWIGALPPLMSFIINLFLLSKYYPFDGWAFFNTVFLKNLLLISVAAIPAWLIQQQLEFGLFRFLIVCTVAVISEFTVIWFLGINPPVRQMLKDKLSTKLRLPLRPR